ncbi:MAG TPA: hypothetical protein VE992_01195 [Solirubrobacteraceae bacterium]|nr:hypothetical protein [Solirubrobacteraceae bacterium]
MSGCSSIVRWAPARRRAASLAAVVVGGALLGACGSSATRQDAAEPSGNFPVRVLEQSFPASQHLSQHARMVLVVQNAGSHAIPDLAVTVCPVTCRYPAPPGEGTSSAVFDSNLGSDSLDNPSPPVWVVDHPPGPPGFASLNGGAGAYATSYSDTWALGHPLAPGASATFSWGVTAVQAGHFTVAWQLAAGLNGKAAAVWASGRGVPHGSFRVTVSAATAKTYVNNSGQIVNNP